MIYNRTLDEDPRTNNNAEAGFRRLRSDFDCSHPTIWKFVATLRQHHLLRDMEYNNVEKGDKLEHENGKWLSGKRQSEK